MATLNGLRSIADAPGINKVTLRPGVRRFTANLVSLRFLPAAWATNDPFRFVFNEARHTAEARYRLRGSAIELVVRHDTGAREVVHEVLGKRIYQPPAMFLQKLPTSPRILDLGANVGAFAAFSATQWPGAAITCVEPDDANLTALRRFVQANPGLNVEIIPACATTGDGEVEFVGGLGSGSRVRRGGIRVQAIDTLPLLQAADFVKCDIEGSEWDLLDDPRLAEIGPTLLVMEYHRRRPGDKGACNAAANLLTRAGFSIGPVVPNYWGHGLIWAYKGQ